MGKKAYVSFGSNIGDAKGNISDAVSALGKVPGITVEKVSSFYETKPWGYEAQQNFVNACARLDVDITPFSLLGVCLGIEAGFGRERLIKNGPRIIDIDLLMYEDEIIDKKELMLPHPRMDERDFVLVPLKDVVDDKLVKEIDDKIKNLKELYVIK